MKKEERIKKEGVKNKLFILFLIIGVIIILSVNIVSASLLGDFFKKIDIPDFLKKILGSGDNSIKEKSGKLYTGSPVGSGYYNEFGELSKKLRESKTVNLAAEPEYECKDADFNYDGKVDADDIQFILSMGVFNAGNICNLNNNWCSQTDINEDGYMNADDIQIILNLGVFNVNPCPCEDKCTSSGIKRCNGNNVETCGNYDSDRCLEWGGSTACPDGKTCDSSTGECVDIVNNAELSISTMKKKYKVREKIQLTSPK